MASMRHESIGNGKVNLYLRKGRYFTVFGGPYRLKKEYAKNSPHIFGVCMAEEIRDPADVRVEVRDFSVPTKEQVDKALPVIVEAILSGKPVYIGCMGGIGRTGLMLGIIAKAFNAAHPLEYVRSTYLPAAMETRKQERFLEEYEIPSGVRKMIKWAKFKSYFTLKKSLTTKL